MNREQFLMALYDALKDLPIEKRSDIMTEYQDYFKVQMEQGKTEEEICLSLGDPITLAYAVKQRAGFVENPSRPSRSSRPCRSSRHSCRGSGVGKLILWIFIAILISGSVFGFKMMSYANKNGGWENMFGFGTEYDINELKEIDFTSAERIEIDASIAGTSLFKNNSGKVKVSLIGKVRTSDENSVPTLEVIQSGDVIRITEKRASVVTIGFFSSRDLKLDISIPESFRGEVIYKGSSGSFTTSNMEFKSFELKLSSGSINLDSITLEKEFTAINSSGSIKVKNLKSSNASMKCSSGSITADDLNLDGDFDIATSSGSIKINNIDCEKIVVNNTSGSISAKNIKTDMISGATSSGGITVSDLEGGARLKSTSGSVDVSSRKAMGEYALSSTSGSVKLTLPSSSDFTLDSKVVSGGISCDFNLENQDKGKKYLRGTYGNGEIPVTLSTTSGSVKVYKR